MVFGHLSLFKISPLLHGKKILLLVSGSIAAYKSAFLVRLLVQHGAEVKVVMSRGALEFITPLTLSTLSKNPVHSDFTENRDSGEWTNHVELALWADLIVAAPLSAHTLSKMASGLCDNFLMAVYMSARCKVMVAPAMDHDMFLHGGTQDNLTKLKSFGHHILEPETGELASGLMGKGRMMEPEHIADAVVRFFNPVLDLDGLEVLVTAGPTYERIDPVRFIGNFSSGKMGFAIAKELATRGAKVRLVSGPSSLNISHPMIEMMRVESAEEMYRACKDSFGSADIAIWAAAVADYTPMQMASEKIKKEEGTITLELTKTKDIALELGREKRNGQILVGFALETEKAEEFAAAKLEKKNLDMIVLNSLRDEGAGFAGDTNKITLLWPGNKKQVFGLKNKADVAIDIVNEIVKLRKK